MLTLSDEDKKMIIDIAEQEGETFLKTTDRLLPVANISKIMKNSIPSSAKVSKGSKDIMQRSASEFIAIVTCRAKNICDLETRKTVTGEDLIRAMDDLDMPYYAEIARKYLEQYKILVERGKKESGRRESKLYENFDTISGHM
ncbi:nuclear transcription Y subunit beta [Pancytospora epiphaga]|nr:nuclear transcription Y subunit beta [Pancytospora epiphaga]